ncbi:hypothetical protein, partial [Leptospira kmetyi]
MPRIKESKEFRSRSVASFSKKSERARLSSYGYEFWIGIHPQTISIFGAKLNFLHRVFLVFLFGLIFHITLSRRFFSEGEWNRKSLNVRVRIFWKTKLRIAIGILW